MQNLRDKLLKAGKVSKKQKRQADQNTRQRRKKRQKKGDRPPEEEAEAKRKALYEAQLAEQQARDLALEEERRKEREAKERVLRSRHIIDYYGQRLRKGRRRWNFVASDRKIRFITIRDSDAWLLEEGRLAIVERLDDQREDDAETYQVVPRETAEVLWEMDDAYVRFWNRPRNDPRAVRWFEEALTDPEAEAAEPAETTQETST